MSPRIEPKFGSAPLLKRKDFGGPAEARTTLSVRATRRWWPWLLPVTIVLLAVLLWQEVQTSFYQAHFLHRYAQQLESKVIKTGSTAIRYPADGPYNQQRGYSLAPEWQRSLAAHGFMITEQSEFSPSLMRYTRFGFYPPYQEKQQTGLHMQDCQLTTIYRFDYPQRQFDSMQQMAPILPQLLAFIENKSILSAQSTYHNPAIEWPRLGAAALSQAQQWLGNNDAAAGGGSTLATQLEKYRHSASGRTSNMSEKFRQMLSASVRAYQISPSTETHRQQLLLHYINTVPLAAAPGFGEVHGLPDGLWAWFGADYQHNNQLLTELDINQETALALKQVLALMIAQRRPSFYLVQGRAQLEQLVHLYLQLLGSDHYLPPELVQLALTTPLEFTPKGWLPLQQNHDAKASQLLRQQLSPMLQLHPYDTDRLDLRVESSVSLPLQQQIGYFLQQLRDPAVAAQHGLIGHRLLSAQDSAHIEYSFVLFQRQENGYQLRAQTDTSATAFDLNSQSKLELGSTAKLRVLVTYLEIIAELYQRYAGEAVQELQLLTIAPQDHISRWVIDQLLLKPDMELTDLLQLSLQRRYSANPAESFFTGGGLHSFGNFMAEDNSRNPTILEATRESINLPFVRLLRDIINYSTYHKDTQGDRLLESDDDTRRAAYLSSFAEREGASYLQQFWRKHRQKSSEQRLEMLLQTARQRPDRMAAIYLWLYPDASPEQLTRFLERESAGGVSSQQLQRWYQSFAARKLSLPDQAYHARLHPLELWLVGQLLERPDLSWAELLATSKAERQEVYQWLFRTRHRSARDNRISIMLEVEAFWDLHYRWQQLGYPFDYLVPSLATALGSSGDRPAALAELMAIIMNDGLRYPSQVLRAATLGENTPYHTRWEQATNQGSRVMEPEVAATLRWVLSEVVRDGTARRLQGMYQQLGISGGKTGTGDNRITTVDSRGNRLDQRSLNRTATFVFYLGPDYFGTLTAYAAGAQSEQLRFTSALPVQVLKSLEPVLLPHLLQNNCTLTASNTD
ncbi:transglycosylase domain-containing protein [Alkalimonas mucilaginosa]|uniref:peptidoglycan glycosyltransferase n=1 Tax=Alkalimonas mucilaginosa TaxID=3057676 RepID=A0ABU7JII9_9GAMM|nr:transglycosylase domain-containing protein [Alkalimonas sp. MEB004]MEE2024910.1 transglycosylase domain-containing protein [Alkalimonas sp. MEB004]